MTTTCTIRSATRGLCGAEAVSTFTGIDGTEYHECAEHATPGGVSLYSGRKVLGGMEIHPAPHPPTATKAPFVLVAHGKIVGYAHGRTPAVAKRAARLGARIVEVVR